jgi:hypothetical protein
MAQNVPQNLANHARLDPPFHFFVLPVLAITVIVTLVHLVRRPGLHSAWLVVLCVALLFLAFKARIYALKVQDRVIRLEERLRLATLLPESLRLRIGELSESQLIALRFASDEEIPALVEATLTKQLAAADIKKAVKNWRADYFRV